MKPLKALLLFLLTAGVLSAQERELYQPDSVYKKNHVKTRTVSFGSESSRAALVFSYDREGRLVQFCLTDNETGKKNQFAITYQYDPSGRRSGELYETNDASERTHTQYVYNKNNELTRKITYDKGHHITEEVALSYNPLVETETFYASDDSIRRRQIAYYDRPNVYYRFTGEEIRDGKKETWDYRFGNVFDAGKRLIQRTDSLWKPCQVSGYYYDDKGLMVKKELHISTSPGKLIRTEYIRYTYWK